MAVVKIRFFSKVIHQTIPLVVFLPEGEGDDDRELKTVWALHGGNSDYTEWLYHSTVVEYAQVLADSADAVH